MTFSLAQKMGLRGSEWVKSSLKGILVGIPPLEKGGEGGFENSWEWICFRIIKV